MECLLGYAPISAAFRCSRRFKMPRNLRQTGWADIFVLAMARNMIWQDAYSMVSLRLTICLSPHTTSSTKRQFELAKIRPAAISSFRRSSKFDDLMRFPATVFATRRGSGLHCVLTVAAQPTTLPFGWAVLLLGQSGPNIEWIIDFDLCNTRCEKTHYRSG